MNWPEHINKIICGDILNVLREIPTGSIDTIITSPPYWSLRDYGQDAVMIWGGEKDCKHIWGEKQLPAGYNWMDYQKILGNLDKGHSHTKDKVRSNFCQKCGAWKGQLGLEPTLDLYLTHLWQIIDELYRVLKKTGVMFWNHGDSYGGFCGGWGGKRKSDTGIQDVTLGYFGSSKQAPPTYLDKKIKPKSLALQNYRLILGMIDRGWILRNTIIWDKPNAMPSSVKDRFSNTHESIFMLVKSKEKNTDIPIWLDNPLNKEDAIWLATMVDTEGTIGIVRQKSTASPYSFGAYITLTNTYKPYLDRAKAITGRGNICERKNCPNRRIWNWRVSHRDAIPVIAEIYPYLMEKKEQSKVAIALQKTNKHRGCPKGSKFGDGQEKMSATEYREKLRLYELIKKLNQREIKDSGLPEPNLNKTGGCERYWFDLDAVRIPHQYPEDVKRRIIQDQQDNIKPFAKDNKQGIKWRRVPGQTKQSIAGHHGYFGEDGKLLVHPSGKNPGDLWTIPTQPFPEAHFATFPEKLVEPMIKSACPQFICQKCGKARVRIIARRKITRLLSLTLPIYFGGQPPHLPSRIKSNINHFRGKGSGGHYDYGGLDSPNGKHQYNGETTGWTDCGCNAGWEAGITLDPFCGASTTGLVALKLGRRYIGIDCVRSYCEMGGDRINEELGELFGRIEIIGN